MSFSSSRFNWSRLTICTSPGVRICFCGTLTCSLGERELMTLFEFITGARKWSANLAEFNWPFNV